MTKLDYSNGVQTRDGREAEVFAEREGRLWGRMKVGATFVWAHAAWEIDGSMIPHSTNVYDLIPLPKLEKRYANVYPNGNISVMTGEPNKYPVDRIGILAFTFRDGVPDVSVAPTWVTP